MRSAVNPSRNNDSFAKMLAAVAGASLATINGAPTTKPTMPDMMQSHHKPPAALALNCGDDSIVRLVFIYSSSCWFSNQGVTAVRGNGAAAIHFRIRFGFIA